MYCNYLFMKSTQPSVSQSACQLQLANCQSVKFLMKTVPYLHCQVCKTCYEDGQSLDGCMRDITAEFIQLRKQRHLGSKGGGRHRGGGWHNRLNLEQECQRLTEGFKRCVGKSEFRRTLHELRSVVSMPDWQKSSSWLVRLRCELVMAWGCGWVVVAGVVNVTGEIAV